MTPQMILSRSASHIDNAIEYLTFPEPAWSFEALWHGVAALLDALAEDGRDAAGATKSVLPVAGSLAERIRQTPAPGSLHDIAAQLEEMRAALDEDAPEYDVSRLEALSFVASDALAAVAVARGWVDPGTVYGAMAGAQGPVTVAVSDEPMRGVDRRQMLQLIGAGVFSMLAAACAHAEPTAPPADPVSGVNDAPVSLPAATAASTEGGLGMQWPTSDPFLFCAYHVDRYPAGNSAQGPDASLSGRSLGRDFDPGADWRMYHGREIPGFPRHPHRGFETVTVVSEGMLDHSDSMGATARFGGGDVQWMTAGAGIQHAEMFPLRNQDRENPLNFFQIWMNLPARSKFVDAHFTMMWNEDIPVVELEDDAGRKTTLTINAGAYGEHAPPRPPPDSWASDADSDVAIWSIRMAPGARVALPAVNAGTERSFYVHRGEGATVADAAVPNRTRVVVTDSGPVFIEAGAAETEILLLQGQPIAEPIARRGPFVMNTAAQIRQAYADYQRTGFGGWPWQGDAPVHERARGRFAIHPDGRVDEPA
ncbi:MAG: pirin family protein [Myxococcota bacterium]